MTRDAPKSYSLVQVALHWIIAALILFQLLVNEGMQHAFDAQIGNELSDDAPWAIVHIVVGIAVLVLAVLRYAIRLTRGAPPPHDSNPAIINWVGYGTHAALYAMIFAMPLTGAFAWFGLNTLSAELHEIGKTILIVLIAFHVLGAFVEHFVFRNDTLLRMLRPGSRKG